MESRVTADPEPDTLAVVFRSWDDEDDRELLVTIFPNGRIEVAERPQRGATWGPPWIEVAS